MNEVPGLFAADHLSKLSFILCKYFKYFTSLEMRINDLNFLLSLWTYESIFLLNEAGKSSTGERRAGKKFLIQKCLQQMGT